MKKMIAVIFAVLTLSALTVSAFAADENTPAAEQEKTAQQETTTQQETTEKQETTTQITAKLTEADALAAALKDAGRKEADVTVTKNKLSEKQTTTGTAIAVYTVKFNTADTTYKYILDANTGTVYYRDVKYQNADVVFKGVGHGEKGSKGEKSSRPAEDSRGGKKGTNGKSTTEGTTDGESTDGGSTGGETPVTSDGQSSGVS